MTIWERIKNALTPLGLPMAHSVWLPSDGEDIPVQYLVYFEISAPPQQHADNDEILLLHHVQVNWFSQDAFPEASLTALLAAMKTAGFTKGPMHDLPYESNDRLFGLALEFYFLEEE